MNNEQLKALKTDAERLLHTSHADVALLAQWEKEAETPENARIFHSYAISAYHKEEYKTYGDI